MVEKDDFKTFIDEQLDLVRERVDTQEFKDHVQQTYDLLGITPGDMMTITKECTFAVLGYKKRSQSWEYVINRFKDDPNYRYKIAVAASMVYMIESSLRYD